MNTTKKIGLAAVLAIALFAGLAAPASANKRIEIVSGTITTVIQTFDLTPLPVTPCPEKADTIAATTNANGTWTLGGAWSGQFELPTGSGNWYQADFVALAGSGGNWGAGVPGTQPLTGVIGIQVRIYQLFLAGQPVNCVKNNLKCIVNTAINVAAPGLAQSTYKAAAGNPPLPATTAGDRITITGTGNAAVSSCTPPFSALGGTTIGITDLQAVVL